MSTAGKSCCSRGSEPFSRQMKIDGSAGWCYNEAESGYAVTVIPCAGHRTLEKKEP